MTTLEIRERIRQYIEVADDRLLNIINAIITEDQNTVVAYTVKGEPLTLAQYRAELEASEREIEEGKVISQEDLEKEIETW